MSESFYKNLLHKYMLLVKRATGENFLNECDIKHFNYKEVKELTRLRDEKPI